jgi:uncharacterized integral membrane protein
MYLAHVIQSRKGRAWVVLIALAIIGILIAAFVLLSGRSPRPFEMNDLYSLLD